MLRLTEVKLPLDHLEDEIQTAILKKLQIAPEELIGYSIFKRSYDARKKGEIVLVYILDVETTQENRLRERLKKDKNVIVTPDMSYRFVAQAPSHLATRPIVIGTGPCGMFAALMLAQMGFRPIVLERGKSVKERTADTFGFWRKKGLNPESNAQFGEGGAGTFSDGKLYSQVRDSQHHGRKVLTELVKAGASPEILYVNKPHIGTFKLVGIVEKMRVTIESLGGEIRFQSRVEDIDIEKGTGTWGYPCQWGIHPAAIALSSRLVTALEIPFRCCSTGGVYIEAKPFSIGFRVEHPQSLIDRSRFGTQAGHRLLGAADYKLVHHCSNGRSVYSFCMCPGGLVVAAASEPGTNRHQWHEPIFPQ